MSFSIRHGPNKPISASHSVIHTQIYRQTMRIGLWSRSHVVRHNTRQNERTDITSISRLQRVSAPTRWWCLHWQSSDCLFWANGNQCRQKQSQEEGVICMFNSCYKLINAVKWDQWSAQQSSGKYRRGSPFHPFPHYLWNPSNISPIKKALKPSSSSSSFVFPFPHHPLFSPPHFHHSPSPCSRILLYKPGTDVCRGRAERPRCSGCQPHAFHSEMKAHSLPSCEANFPKKKKKKKKGGKNELQMPSSAFKSITYMSTPFCLYTVYCSLRAEHQWHSFLEGIFGRTRGGNEKLWDVADECVLQSWATSTHKWKAMKK